MKKVVAYIRVSTKEQEEEGHSLDTQEKFLHDFALGNDLQIVQEFRETRSAFRPGRPRFREMIQLLHDRPDVVAVLVYKLDRLARNMQDFAELEEMKSVEVISATEGLPRGSTGELLVLMVKGFARFTSSQLSERVPLGMKTKAAKGLWPSYAPIGYLNDKENGIIVPDPERAALIHDLYETYARTDMSLAGLVRWAEVHGLRSRRGYPLRTSTIHWILTNPIYYGPFKWKGEIYNGTQEPLVSEALFMRVEERLSGRSHPRSKREFPFRGLLRCGICGCMITASLKKGKYVYYHCTGSRGKCSQPYVRQERLSDMLVSVVEGVNISHSQLAEVLDSIEKDKERRFEEQRRRVRKLRERRKRLEHRREAAYEDKLDGKISEERWLQRDREWSQQDFQLRCELELLEDEREPQWDDVRATLELLERAPQLYLQQNDYQRARLLKLLAWNCELNGENITPIYRKPFSEVAVGIGSANWYARQDSNL